MRNIQRRQKVLLVSQFGQFGGAKTYFIELLKYYSEQLFDVTACIYLEGQHEDVINIIDDLGISCHIMKKRWHGIKDFWNKPPFSLLMDIILVYRVYQKVKPELIVVSTTSPETFLGLALFPKPFIGVIHTYPTGNSRKLLWRMRCLVRNFILNRLFNLSSKRLITVSEYSKKRILDTFNIPSSAASVIYNFGSRSGNTTFSRSVDNKFYILTFGHVTYYKNPLIWIKVAERVINYLTAKKIEFIWGGDGDLLNQCRNKVGALGLAKQIKFIGYTSDVASYYATASLYFQPSTIESHGISVVEAMSHSLPCVASNIGGLPESIKHGINGFLTHPDDVDAMSDSIIKLIENNPLRQEMGKNSLCIFNEKFSYPIWKKKMDEFHVNRVYGYAN